MINRLQKFCQFIGMDYSLVKSYDEQSAERFIREVKEEVYTTNGFEILEENGEFAQKGWSLSCNASHKNSPPNFFRPTFYWER